MRAELERAALELVRRMQRDYFERRDLEAVRAVLEPGCDWVGVGGADIGHMGQIWPEGFGEPGAYAVVEMPMVAEALDGSCCIVSGSTTVREERAGVETEVRLSALCRQGREGLRLRQVHMSVPGLGIPAGGAVQAAHLRESLLSQLLDRQNAKLAERDRNLDMLLNNLPGGVICCDNSPELNLIEYSQGFLDLFGYTRREVRELFRDQFARMILPEDLKATWSVVDEQMAKGSTKQIEYRIRRKDGRTVWVLDRGQLVRREDGSGYFYCILLDVTETRQAREALQTSLERHKIIMDQTNDIIFEWDMDQDRIEMAGNWEKKFGYPAPPGRAADWLEDNPRVHPDDMDALRRLHMRLAEDETYGEAEARVSDAWGRYIWCRLRVSVLHTGERRRAVGVVVDIDSEMRKTQRLRQLAERDTLTGLYNKGTAQRLIETALETAVPGEFSALMILDVDDFKQVNDRYGHLGGDAMLSDIAGALQGLFRQGDILGRIGGDEFCVFLTGLKDTDILKHKAEEVLRVFREPQQLDRQGDFSCSLGIAVAPMDGRDYVTLFQNADVSLYHAKTKGKNQYAFYTQGMDWPELRSELWASRSAGRDRIESENGGQALGGTLAEYVFRVLYKAPDVHRAIPLILEIVGRQFDVSRMYIYELEDDGRHVNNTFEWCNEGITPEIDNLQHVPVEDIRDMIDALQNQGGLYCRDVSQLSDSSREILERQGIRATLQCPINDGGQFMGAVGFDECRSLRLWTQEQVDALTFIADIVSTFLTKGRARDQNADLMESLKSILDHQRQWLYVVDPDSHEILYANRMTREAVPGLKPGMRCHEAFYGRDGACAYCPAGKLAGGGSAWARLRSTVLDMEVDARADTVTWTGGRRAYLLSCQPVERERGEA